MGIEEIEDEYKQGQESAVAEFKESIGKGTERKIAESEFIKKIKNSRERYNLAISKIIKKEGNVKYKPKELKKVKTKEFKAEGVEIEEGKADKLSIRGKILMFRVKLFLKGIKHFVYPPFMHYIIFKLKYFFSSLFLDIGRSLKRTLGYFKGKASKIYGFIRGAALKVIGLIKNLIKNILGIIKKAFLKIIALFKKKEVKKEGEAENKNGGEGGEKTNPDSEAKEENKEASDEKAEGGKESDEKKEGEGKDKEEENGEGSKDNKEEIKEEGEINENKKDEKAIVKGKNEEKSEKERKEGKTITKKKTNKEKTRKKKPN